MTRLTQALARFPRMPAVEHLHAVTGGGAEGLGDAAKSHHIGGFD